MATLNPYLQFVGTAREAATFYQEVFGGELNVMTFGDMGGAPDVPEDGVMHAQLETPDGFTLMLSDRPPGMTEVSANGHVSLSGDEVEKLTGFFEALAQGGRVDVPLEKQMWGDHFGQVKDRFEVNWLVNISGAPAEQ
jgi:PhnB protein